MPKKMQKKGDLVLRRGVAQLPGAAVIPQKGLQRAHMGFVHPAGEGESPLRVEEFLLCFRRVDLQGEAVVPELDEPPVLAAFLQVSQRLLLVPAGKLRLFLQPGDVFPGGAPERSGRRCLISEFPKDLGKCILLRFQAYGQDALPFPVPSRAADAAFQTCCGDGFFQLLRRFRRRDGADEHPGRTGLPGLQRHGQILPQQKRIPLGIQGALPVLMLPQGLNGLQDAADGPRGFLPDVGKEVRLGDQLFFLEEAGLFIGVFL